MTRRSLALVANFHRERRIGRKTANFLGKVQARLEAKGVDFRIEFVLDRPDESTIAQIETAAAAIPDSRIHQVDFGNLGISRTFGVNAARADVVCFTDGDDFFSFNWFEDSLEFFSSKRPPVVLHTQYMVGFDNEQFIRETTQSTDPWFDPLSLASEWYWSANLAMRTDVFASTPIQPYDHARGFGSEDWHWTCNCLAEGIERVALPNTTYFYRVKPERFALGKVADVIHMASPLFEAGRAPPRTSGFMPEPPPVVAPSKAFFEQAREIERYELGVSYLRAVEIGAETVRHFRPHTPPIVGQVYRDAMAAGFGANSVIVFADGQRLPGGLDAAASLCTAITSSPPAGRLYIVDGDQEACQARPDGYVLQLGDLRAAGLYNDQIDRLIARFFIQNNNLTVLNLLSPRNASRALAFSRATRGSVARWINLVAEYGFDALSQAYDELDMFAAAGIDAENVAVFAKTAIEARAVRDVSLVWAPALEAAYVSGDLRSISPGAMSWRTPEADDGVRARSPWQVPVLRAESIEAAGRGWVTVGDAQREMVREAPEVILVGGDTFVGEEVGRQSSAGAPGIRIPALTVVRTDKPPAYYFRPQVVAMSEALAHGRVPADLGYVGAIGVAGDLFREMLEASPDRVSVAALVSRAINRARGAGLEIVTAFGDGSVVSASSEDLESLGGAKLLLDISRAIAGATAHG